MRSYYTRVCNFYYGSKSKKLVNKKKNLPLNGNNQISFNKIEVITRKSKKTILVHEINKLPNDLKKKIKKDIKVITKNKKKFNGLSIKSIPKIMGILNITPDSFSDGGRYNKNDLAKKHCDYLFKSGADIVDIGGESTRPGSKSVSSKVEWNRIKDILKKIDKKKINISRYKKVRYYGKRNKIRSIFNK